MQEYEANTIIENLPYLDRTSWEQTRFQVYTSIQMNSKKKYSPDDIMKFAWETEGDEKDTSISMEDIERLRNKSKEIFESIKDNGK